MKVLLELRLIKVSKYVYHIDDRKIDKLSEIALYLDLISVTFLLDLLVDGLIKEYDDDKSFIRGIL